MKVKNIFLKGVLVFGIILLIWYCIRNLIINPIYNQILPWFLRNNDITASNLLERVCDLLSLLIAAIIMPLLLKGVDLYIDKKKERSSISVYSRREKNISGVKKKIFNHKYLYSDLRTNKKEYRAIYATIKNTGNSCITEFSLGKKPIHIDLQSGKTKDFFILIDTSYGDKIQNPSLIEWQVKFRDSSNQLYSMKFNILVDLNDLQANFVVSQKAKRIKG